MSDDIRLIWSNVFGWLGLRYGCGYNGRFVELWIGTRGEKGRRVSVFDCEGENTSEENAKTFAAHIFKMLDGEPK